MALVTHDDLTKPSYSDASSSMAQVAVSRMQDPTSPMPPAPASAVPADAIAAFKAWVDGGAPTGNCATAGNPYDTPTVCTSNSMWTRGNRGSASMHPGGACNACHSSSDDGPSFSIAGTVFPTAHEPDDCNGASGASGVQVVITGANGQTLTLKPNSVGNFFSYSSVSLPYTAKVVSGGKERAMGTAQTDGDCNGCHTLTGSNGAPGRIMAP